MQKTGCTHISNLLAKYVGGTKIGKHNWLENYDTEKTIIGSIRNPWDWYVSLWAYGSSDRGGLYQRLTHRVSWKEQGKRVVRRRITEAFKELTKPIDQWKSTYGDNENPMLFRNWLTLVLNPKRAVDLGENYYACSLSNFAEFMSYRYCKLHMRDFFLKRNFTGIQNLEELKAFDATNNLLHDIIRNESLEKDFIRVVQEAGHQLDQTMIQAIFQEAENKTNISEHRDSAFYYDDATIELVAQKEAFLIDKYSYKPPN